MPKYGFDVTVRFNEKCPFKEKSVVYHNVTEIHYLYPSMVIDKKVAFESDIHFTGCTTPVKWIAEFEAVLAKKIHKSF